MIKYKQVVAAIVAAGLLYVIKKHDQAVRVAAAVIDERLMSSLEIMRGRATAVPIKTSTDLGTVSIVICICITAVLLYWLYLSVQLEKRGKKAHTRRTNWQNTRQ